MTPYTNATTVQGLIYTLYAEAMLVASLNIVLPPVSNSTALANTSNTTTGRRRSLQAQQLGQPVLRNGHARSLESVLTDYDVFQLIASLAQAIVQSNAILLNNVLTVSAARLPYRRAAPT